jgi:SAM-dependent methyltransferase
MESLATPNMGYDQYNQSAEFDYLSVDSFIKSIVDARALASAFELRLIDHLVKNQPLALDDLKKRFRSDAQGLQLLLNLLMSNRVVEESNGEIRLTQQFMNVLRYRDLLEAKLEFSNFALPDFMDLFTLLIQNPDRFNQHARIFDLFGYSRCFEYNPENYKLTKRWMRITTSLTKYEAQVCMKYHDFGQCQRLLDIGGNSGEFVLQICKRYPGIVATVFDLPLVCDIGEEYIRSEPEADRIKFIKGNALTDTLPKGFDLITFKSMLHDWPAKEAKRLIVKASQSLEPGGTLLIFERGPLEVSETTLPYSMIPFLLFFRSFRSPVIYEEQLGDSDFQDISVQEINLETPFYLVTARKASLTGNDRSGKLPETKGEKIRFNLGKDEG